MATKKSAASAASSPAASPAVVPAGFKPLREVLPGFEKVPESILIPARTPSEHTPPKRYYKFSKKLAKLAQHFLSGEFPYLLMQGPTGSGKSEYLEQLAAHTGWGYEPIACNEDTEIQSLMWETAIAPDGSTVKEAGPIVRGMTEGRIIVFEEFNTIPPEQQGYLNTVLDRRTFIVPHTGKVLPVHPDFRLAVTANDVNQETGEFKGTRKQNPAFLRRFQLKVILDYLAANEELEIIANRAPGIQKKPLLVMHATAIGCRKLAKDGQLAFTCSTAELVNWARLVVFNCQTDEQMQLAYLPELLKVAALDALPTGERIDVLNALDGVMKSQTGRTFADVQKSVPPLW